MKERIKNNPDFISDEVIKRAAHFISNLNDSGNYNLRDLVRSGIFENLANDNELKSVIVPLLSEKARKEYLDIWPN